MAKNLQKNLTSFIWQTNGVPQMGITRDVCGNGQGNKMMEHLKININNQKQLAVNNLGPDSSYSCLEIHICWKTRGDAKTTKKICVNTQLQLTHEKSNTLCNVWSLREGKRGLGCCLPAWLPARLRYLPASCLPACLHACLYACLYACVAEEM